MKKSGEKEQLIKNSKEKMEGSSNSGSTDETLIKEDKRKVRSSGYLIKKGVLLALSDNLFGRSFIIDRDCMTIGRSENCDILIEDPLVSKRHCMICVDDEENFFLEDLGSKNSTYINKKRIKKRTRILYGDRIALGNTILRFFLEEKLHKK